MVTDVFRLLFYLMFFSTFLALITVVKVRFQYAIKSVCFKVVGNDVESIDEVLR